MIFLKLFKRYLIRLEKSAITKRTAAKNLKISKNDLNSFKKERIEVL